MADFPSTAGRPVGTTLTTASVTAAAGMIVAGRTSFASAVWPSANLAIATPVRVEIPITVFQIFWYNGTAVSGNVDVGVYDAQWNRKVSSGSTLQAGTSNTQVVDVTDTTLTPGVYFIAMCVDNTTATVFRMAAFNSLVLEAAGVQQQAVGTVTLPDPFVPANPANAYVPLMGLSTAGSVF